MKASSCIVPGCFRGAEIEPGTFHGAEIEPGTFHGRHLPPQDGRTGVHRASAASHDLPVPSEPDPTEANCTRT